MFWKRKRSNNKPHLVAPFHVVDDVSTHDVAPPDAQSWRRYLTVYRADSKKGHTDREMIHVVIIIHKLKSLKYFRNRSKDTHKHKQATPGLAPHSSTLAFSALFFDRSEMSFLEHIRNIFVASCMHAASHTVCTLNLVCIRKTTAWTVS